MHATRWGHVQVVAGNHVDLDLPLTGDLLAVGHDGQDNWISAAATHVDVDVLTTILSAKDGQSFADGGSDHEGVGGAKTILIRLSQSELFEVQTELADTLHLLDGHLAGIGAILASRVGGIDEDGFVLVGGSATCELEGTAGTESVGTRSNSGSGSSGTFSIG